MARIDFKNFEMWEGIAHRQKKVVDIREGVADLIYKNVSGMRGHMLAHKVYESDGMTEFTDEETKIIINMAEQLCVGPVIDGLHEQLANQQKEEIV